MLISSFRLKQIMSHISFLSQQQDLNRKVNNFVELVKEAETKDNLPNWIILLLKSFKLLSSDFQNVNDELFNQTIKLDERIQSLEGKVALQETVTEQLKNDRDLQQLHIQNLEKKMEESIKVMKVLLQENGDKEIDNKTWIFDRWLNQQNNEKE